MSPQTHTTRQLIDWDRQYLWHPFTPMKPWCEDKDILIIARGEREFLFDTEGRRYIDGTSSIWCNVHGHCVPELDSAVKAQLDQIAHSSLLGLGNIPSILLAKRLVELVHACGLALDKVFYSDDGSTAVEVACKMAYQYWRNVASPTPGSDTRTRFIALGNAYHGDTLGAVSLGGIPIFHAAFKSLCFPVDFVSPPTQPDSLAQIERLLKANPHAYAGIIVEPLVLGAGGMIIYPPEILGQLRALADRYRVLLIFDEVMTGFGRTGTMFAAEQGRVTPDLLCLSKGLTAGYMPLGVTLTTRKIFDAFYADPRVNPEKTFFHGHTFTGHPLACAVALASLDLFDQTHLLVHVQRMSAILAKTLEKSRKYPYVGDVRHLGLIGAIELVADRTTRMPFPSAWRVGGALCTKMRSLNLLMRPLADVIVIMPPLAIREENMRHLCDGVLNSLQWLPEIVAQKTREFPT